MKKTLTILLAILIGTFITTIVLSASMGNEKKTSKPDSKMEMEKNNTAVFAGGCFWCVEADYEKIDGVIDAISGYAGGHQKNPTYNQVSGGTTGHVESVKVIYDPKKVTYEQLLDYFWRHIDPTDAGGQFVDRGTQYRSVIFYQDEQQKTLAESSRIALENSHRLDKPIVTDIIKLNVFYRAEDYHQDYYKTHSVRYKYYRWHSGRDQFLEKQWGKNDKPFLFLNLSKDEIYNKPDDATLRKRLTDLQI